ncbi:MAG: hypothetical protein R3F13_05515 [Prosthecobacter sp.]
MKPSILILAVSLLLGAAAFAQSFDAARFRELREKSRSGTLTPEEKAELDAVMQARTGGRPAPPSTPPAPPSPTPMPPKPGTVTPTTPPAAPQSREEMRKKRMDEFAERQEFVFARSREFQKTALAAAALRKAPSHPPRALFVNNETGDDSASGLAADKAVKTLAKAVSLLLPGDTLHLAVTRQPYRETLRLGDDFGGVAGRPITIEGHGATITGSDPLRLDGWVEAGEPGLYKSAKFINELEEFDDGSKLMRVYFIFDGVMQHMGRSSKGARPHFKSPQSLQAGEWSYVESEKTFYLKVNGKLADAKIEAPYRRNGVGIRSPKVALTHVVIKDLIVCHVLNDGWNLHGTTQDLLLKNIAAYECGDDGISPHETCEVEIDGFWSVGNSTGMGNGNLSVTKARNVHLEGNLAHQLMTGHAPLTELSNSIIIAPAGTEPINVTNAQDTRLIMDNVQITAPATQKVLNVVNGQITAKRVTSDGPIWENAGTIEFIDSLIGRPVTNLPGGTSKGETHGTGAAPAEFKIPPRPVPHPAAGKFSTLVAALKDK